MPTRLLIVEDHPIFAEALQLIIRGSLPEVSITHASTLGAAKETLRSDKDYDLALLDLWLPDTHGFEGLIELRRLFRKLPIVVISAFADAGIVHKSVVCGAAGFIPKSSGRDGILQAIRTVLAGNVALPASYLPPGLVASEELATLTGRLGSLTQQQLRVLQMLCQGLLNKQIAYVLDVGETTVKAHVSEILRKLSVSSRTQAVLEISRLDLSAVLALYANDDFGAPQHAQHSNGGSPA